MRSCDWLRWSVYFGAMFLTAACTDNPTAHVSATFSPRPDQRLNGEQKIQIPKNFIYSRQAIDKRDFGLVEGIYVAEFQDNYGKYFRGPKGCVFLSAHGHSDTTVHQDGGIYLPNPESNAQPTIYYYIGSTMNAKQFDQYELQQSVAPVTPSTTTAQIVGGAIGVGIVSGIVSGLNGKIAFHSPPNDWGSLIRNIKTVVP
ncbi:hypothetical protein [Nevskia soli]|uniref:hypothetical protein n=1 Tax=Nevskia soli TaxID=418856 RepID=UPI0012FBC395|nr:hypothetical protein [Nevskia soli]